MVASLKMHFSEKSNYSNFFNPFFLFVKLVVRIQEARINSILTSYHSALCNALKS